MEKTIFELNSDHKNLRVTFYQDPAMSEDYLAIRFIDTSNPNPRILEKWYTLEAFLSMVLHNMEDELYPHA